MTSRQRTTVCATGTLLFSMLSSVLLLHHVDEIRPRDIVDDTLYIASPKLVKRASLGFNGLMACIYWTRAVQYFGHRHLLREQSYHELGPLLEITATLDPQLLAPYQFGSTFLAPAPPNGAGQPQRAIRLMEYGIQNNPQNWRLYYDLGFIYYTELKDFKKASEAFQKGSQIPDAHPFLKVLAANTAEHAEDFTTARLLWSAAYQNSDETNIRQNAVEHLRAIQVDEDVTNLQNAVTRFVDKNGRIPTSLWEIASAEHLPGVPLDPDGVPYELSLDGQVLVANPDEFPFIKKGTPPGYTPGPPKFHKQHWFKRKAGMRREPYFGTIRFVQFDTAKTPGILSTAGNYWNDHRLEKGVLPATAKLFSALWEFVRNSTPERLRAKFGDAADYDWDYRVNTTSGAVGWRERLLGQFLNEYQPTGPTYFLEMIEDFQRYTNADLREFTFIDLGSGKGRALLMASNYPFRRIIGVELLPSLNEIARDNIARYQSDSQQCFLLEAVCADATTFRMPEGPLILYLFNPFPESGLRRTLATLQRDLASRSGEVYLLYHNSVLEHVLEGETFLNLIARNSQYSLYAAGR